MRTHYISNWEIWEELCEQNDIDPYEQVDHSIDEGGGNSRNWEYIGDIPSEEKEKEEEVRK